MYGRLTASRAYQRMTFMLSSTSQLAVVCPDRNPDLSPVGDSMIPTLMRLDVSQPLLLPMGGSCADTFTSRPAVLRNFAAGPYAVVHSTRDLAYITGSCTCWTPSGRRGR